MQDTFVNPEPAYVRQITPQGRTAQRRNREAIEKGMLRQRNSNFERHGPEIEEPYLIERGTDWFMSDSERFHTDVSGEAKRQRELEYQKRDLAAAHLREERLTRDNTRWETLDDQARIQEERVHRMRETGQKTKKNMSGVAFNPLSHQTHNTDQGRQLAREDENYKARAELRAKNMQRAGSGGFNPITGAPY